MKYLANSHICAEWCATFGHSKYYRSKQALSLLDLFLETYFEWCSHYHVRKIDRGILSVPTQKQFPLYLMGLTQERIHKIAATTLQKFWLLFSAQQKSSNHVLTVVLHSHHSPRYLIKIHEWVKANCTGIIRLLLHNHNVFEYLL